jgi:hypothetical protein
VYVNFPIASKPPPFSISPPQSPARSRGVDLNGHSEGPAATAVRWWLDEEIRPWLSEQPSSVYPDIAAEFITGWGKQRETWQTCGVKQAVVQALVEMGVPLELKPEGRNISRGSPSTRRYIARPAP